MKNTKTFDMVLFSLFIAIIFILGLTPVGFIMLPIAAITTVHIPVILGGYTFGVKGGALLGCVFGLTSLIRAFTTPDVLAAILLGTNTGFSAYNVFLIIMILFLPRILTGVFSALSFKAIAKKDRSKVFAMGISAFIGSITNTVFFLGGLFLFAYDQAAAGFGLANPSYTAFLKVLLGIVSVNGMLEALAAVILCTLIGKAIFLYRDSSRLQA